MSCNKLRAKSWKHEVSRFQSFKVSGFQSFTRTLGLAACPDHLLAHVAEFAGMSFLGQGWMNMEELWKTNATLTPSSKSDFGR